jgi:aspartate aminotransferase-like enzyme
VPAPSGGDQADGDGGVRMSMLAFAEAVAARLLAREGIAAIWQLHVAAARVHRQGNHLAALSIIQIADAAERLWITRSG